MHALPLPRRVLLSAGLAVALAACAAGSASSGGAYRSSSTRLTAEEIEQDPGLDLYTIIERRRPRWLQVRASANARGPATISVIIDGAPQQGSVELLRGLRGADVQEARFLNARDATTRYGTNNTAGAIEVETRRGGGRGPSVGA